MREGTRFFRHSIDHIFILLLLSVFTVCAVLTILIGARQYQAIADNMEYNYEARTAASYLEEKLRQSDLQGSVSLTELGSIPAIALSKETEQAAYTTYIYCYQNYLREITVSKGSDFLPKDGQEIMKAKELTIDQLTANLYCFTITDTSGTAYPVYVSLHVIQ